MAAVTCSVCGGTEPDPPVGWSLQVTSEGPVWLCEDCTRSHLRALEARLDPGWW